eukprot:gene37577-64740_t
MAEETQAITAGPEPKYGDFGLDLYTRQEMVKNWAGTPGDASPRRAATPTQRSDTGATRRHATRRHATRRHATRRHATRATRDAQPPRHADETPGRRH